MTGDKDERRADYLLLGRLEQSMNDLCDNQRETFTRIKDIEAATTEIKTKMDGVMTPAKCALDHDKLKNDIVASIPRPLISGKIGWVLIVALAAIAIMASAFAFEQKVSVPGIITVDHASGKVVATPMPAPVAPKGK